VSVAILSLGGLRWTNRNADLAKMSNFRERLPFSITGQIEKVKWSPDKSYKQFLRSCDTPIVLTNSKIETWPARKLWNPQYFINKFPVLGFIRSTWNETIWHHNGCKEFPMCELREIPWEEDTYNVTEYTTKEFFNRLYSKDPTAYYFYENLLDVPDEVGELSELRKDFDLEWIFAHGGPIHLWIAKAGVTTQVHYDLWHNTFVQLWGRRHFLLFPPTEYSKFSLFPRSHPYWRQSQVSLTSANLRDFPDLSNVKAFEVIVEEGDLLWVPAYWFHVATTLDVSISLTLSEITDEFAHFNYESEVNNLMIPEFDFQDDDDLIRLVKEYIHLLVDRIRGAVHSKKADI